MWQKGKNGRGYGTVTPEPGAKQKYVHRLAYEDAYGPIPEGLGVLHKCNNPACFNPEHLYAGTHQQNMHDTARSGVRWKISFLEVAQIAYRHHILKEALSALAKEYKISPSQVWHHTRRI